MRPRKPAALLVLLMMVLFLLTACVADETSISFSFQTDGPANSYDERVVYLDQDIERLKLDIALDMQGGTLDVWMEDLDGQLIWSRSFTEATRLSVDLRDLKAGTGYRMGVRATQADDVKLTIKTNEKLTLGLPTGEVQPVDTGV